MYILGQSKMTATGYQTAPLCRFLDVFTGFKCTYMADMGNSIETAIAIDILGTIAIAIAIAKSNSQLLLLLLVLLRGFPNYCYCY